jgi:hypothetical protein
VVLPVPTITPPVVGAVSSPLPNVAAATVEDVHIKAKNILRIIVAQKLKKRVDEIPLSKTIKDLVCARKRRLITFRGIRMGIQHRFFRRSVEILEFSALALMIVTASAAGAVDLPPNSFVPRSLVLHLCSLTGPPFYT